MDSKNNNHRHRFEREYFDAPHLFIRRGFQFKTVHPKPHLLTSANKMMASEIDSPATLPTATSRHLSILDNGSSYKVKNPDILPVTNGMSET